MVSVPAVKIKHAHSKHRNGTEKYTIVIKASAWKLIEGSEWDHGPCSILVLRADTVVQVILLLVPMWR